MLHIEDLLRPERPQTLYRVVPWGRIAPCDMWLPSLPEMTGYFSQRIADAWAVFTGRAAAVQWPHQREPRR